MLCALLETYIFHYRAAGEVCVCELLLCIWMFSAIDKWLCSRLSFNIVPVCRSFPFMFGFVRHFVENFRRNVPALNIIATYVCYIEQWATPAISMSTSHGNQQCTHITGMTWNKKKETLFAWWKIFGMFTCSAIYEQCKSAGQFQYLSMIDHAILSYTNIQKYSIYLFLYSHCVPTKCSKNRVKKDFATKQQ